MEPRTVVKRDSMRDLIRKALLQRILDGTYRPGDRLIELQVAREFHTSQGPVREALRELEALRLVETETYRGTRVRSVSGQEMYEAAIVRGLLEQEAARTAAPRLKADISPLQRELDALRRAAAAGDHAAYARHNRGFHRVIAEASGNAVLLRVWDSLMLEVRTLIGLSQFDVDLTTVVETHAPILEALARGDAAEGGRLLREHAEMFGQWAAQLAGTGATSLTLPAKRAQVKPTRTKTGVN
jgi:DNA-binding GntR family transcriptional regulator